MHELKAQIIMAKQWNCLVVMVFFWVGGACSGVGKRTNRVVGGTTIGGNRGLSSNSDAPRAAMRRAVLAIRSGKERIGKKNLTNLRKDPTQRAPNQSSRSCQPQSFSSGQRETDRKEERQSIT